MVQESLPPSSWRAREPGASQPHAAFPDCWTTEGFWREVEEHPTAGYWSGKTGWPHALGTAWPSPGTGKLGRQCWSRGWQWQPEDGQAGCPSTHVWPAWPGYHWAQLPFLCGQQAWTQRETKNLWGTSCLESVHCDYSPFGVSPGASPHQSQVPPPVDPTGPGLPGQSSNQMSPLLNHFGDPLMLRRLHSFGVRVYSGVLCWHCVTVSLVH